MGIFGWDLPPGCSIRDLPGYDDPPCAVCGKDVDACVCAECPKCGEFGDPKCYAAHKDHNGHGMKLTKEQHIAIQEGVVRQVEDDLQAEKVILEMMNEDPDFNFEEYPAFTRGD